MKLFTNIFYTQGLFQTLAALVAVIASSWFFPSLLKIAQKGNFFDVPDERKLQKKPTAVGGGIVVFFGLTVSYLAFLAFGGYGNITNAPRITIVLLCSLIALYIGVVDDLKGLGAGTRFALEAILMLLLIFGNNMCVDSLHGLFGVEEFSWWIAVPLTVFAGVGIINAYNMVDGVNGLSSLLCFVGSFFLGVITFKRGDFSNSALAFCFAASLIPFFVHNVFGKKSRMFIGDGGTMVMGVLFSWFMIRVLSSNQEKDFTALPAPGLQMCMVAMILAVASVPVADTLRVMAGRILHGHSPFKPDKTHLHHAFIAVGFSHLATAISEAFFNLVIIFTWYGVYKHGYSNLTQFIVVVVSSMVLVWGTYFLLCAIAKRGPDTKFSKFARKTHLEDKRWWIAIQNHLDKQIENEI